MSDFFFKFSGYLPYYIPTWCLMSKMTPSSKSSVRNPQHLPSPKWSQTAKSGQIFIKLSGYLPDHLPTWSIMAKKTPFFKSPVSNHHHSPSPSLIVIKSWSLAKLSLCIPIFKFRGTVLWHHHNFVVSKK